MGRGGCTGSPEYVSTARGGGSYDAGRGAGVSSTIGLDGSGTNGVIDGISRPPALRAISLCAASWRSGARSGPAISRSAPWARSTAGPMAPLAIERIVTTRPGASSGGAGAPAGSTPKAAQIAIPHERTSARRSPWLGAPRTAATGWPASRTSPLPVRRMAVASKPPIATPAS